MAQKTVYIDSFTGEYIDEVTTGVNDNARYLKTYFSNFFAELELGSMEQRCWFMIKYYLSKDMEFFYMTDSAMLLLLEKHFGKRYNERVVANALNALVKRGWFVRVQDGLCIINFYLVFNGNRDGALIRHYDYDLFGMRDPMARNHSGGNIRFKKDAYNYACRYGMSITELRNRCLSELRKRCRSRTIA